jgi:hypothetical protein
MKRLRIRGHGGYGLIEVLGCTAIVSIAGLMLARFISKPDTTLLLMNGVDQERAAYHVMDLPIDELKSADYSSIAWSGIDPTDLTGFNPTRMPWFHLYNPSAAAPDTYVCYHYVADSNTEGSLVRESTSVAPSNPLPASCDHVNGNAQSVIAKNIALPTIAAPLFERDMASLGNEIILTVQTLPPGTVRRAGQNGSLVYTASRRVALRT